MIVGYADHIEADLILMPTRGYGPMGQLLFGSTTMDVIRSTPRAVWVATKEDLRSARRFSCKRIVCGIDVTAEGQTVLNHAIKVAAAWQADLMIVHAIPGISDAVLVRYGLDERDDIELLLDAARRKIRSMAARVKIPYQVHVEIDDPPECLRRALRKWSADLLIVGRGKRIGQWSVGANIARIVERASCPVFTFPHHRVAASYRPHVSHSLSFPAAAGSVQSDGRVPASVDCISA
jgi:nucleotide-binding universal stress UspA family protein